MYEYFVSFRCAAMIDQIVDLVDTREFGWHCQLFAAGLSDEGPAFRSGFVDTALILVAGDQ